jgi:glycosyltransferase involved in cell wall biosynthesis
MKPKVTVVIPTYKRPVELRRALMSVENQDYENLEIIVVDDNAPDSFERFQTETMMSEFESEFVIKYIKHKANRNGAVSRNTGIAAAEGKYIAFLDDDDEYKAKRISRIVDRMEDMDESYGVCHTSFRSYQSDSKFFIGKEKIEGNAYSRALMRNLFIGSGSNIFVRSSVVQAVCGFDEAFVHNQDLEFLTRVLEKFKIAYIDEDLLVIHSETRKNRTSFNGLKKTDAQYKEKFKDQIESLSDDERNALENFFKLNELKYSLYRKQHLNSIRLLFTINPILVTRYTLYLIKRNLNKEAYGFDI